MPRARPPVEEPVEADRRVPAGPRLRPLASESTGVLPELAEVEQKPRSLWRHPAFVVSMALTTLAIIATAVLLIVNIVGGQAPPVESAEIEAGGGNLHLTWTGASDVDLYAVTGGETLDLSQLIRGGAEAWVPAGLGFYDDSTCFVIRPSVEAEAETPVSLTADALAEQGAASVCVAEATGG